MGRLTNKEKERREESIQLSPKPSIRTSAERYDIPYTTLRDRLVGVHTRREGHQHQQLLMPNEEKSIVKWIGLMDDRGFPPKIAIVKEMAADLVQKRVSGYKLRKNWLSRFLGRNPEIASRFANRLDRARNNVANPTTIKDYFRKLRQVIKEYEIIPENEYNKVERL